MTTENMIAFIGDSKAGKTTTAASMMMNPLRQHAGQGVVGHTAYPGWVADTSGFLLQQVSPPLKAAMGALAMNKFPKKTKPDAVAEDGELAVFQWQNEPWELHSLPGESLFTAQKGIDVNELLAGLADYRAVVLTFPAPLVTYQLGWKFVLGLTEVFLSDQLGYRLADAVAAAVGLSFGLSRTALDKQYPRQMAVLREHDHSGVSHDPASGQFVITAQKKGVRVPADEVERAVGKIVRNEHQRRLGGHLTRNLLPLLAGRAIIALTHTDLSGQFFPQVVTESDYMQAFAHIWGGIPHTSVQCVTVPNVVLELQPNTPLPPVAKDHPVDPPADDDGPKAAAKKKPRGKKRVVAEVVGINPDGAARLWSSIHSLTANPQPTPPVSTSRPHPGPVPPWFRRMFPAKVASNGTA